MTSIIDIEYFSGYAKLVYSDGKRLIIGLAEAKKYTPEVAKLSLFYKEAK